MVYEPEIGDVDEGIVLIAQLVVVSNKLVLESAAYEAGEDAGNCEPSLLADCDDRKHGEELPTAKNELAFPDLGAQGNVLLRGTRGSLGGRHSS